MLKISNTYKRAKQWGGFALVAALMLVGVGLAPSTASANEANVRTNCGLCHGLTVNGVSVTTGAMVYNVSNRDAATWESTIRRMIGYGCPYPNNPEAISSGACFLASLPGTCAPATTTTVTQPTTTVTQPTTTVTQPTTTVTQPTTTVTQPTTTTTTNGGGNAAAGQALFGANCAGCHGADGAGSPPSIPCVKGKAAADIDAAIAQGGIMALIAGGLTAQEKADLAAYLATLGSCGVTPTTTSSTTTTITIPPPTSTTTTQEPTTTTTTQAPTTTTTTQTPPPGFPSNCGMCHAIPTSGGTPNACSPTFDAAKRASMSGFTGGAVSVAQIDATVAGLCGAPTTTTTQTPGSTTTTQVPGSTTTTQVPGSTTTTKPQSVMFQLFGWTDTRKQHRSYAERNGVSQCVGCHSIVRGVPSPNPAAPSCFTCHGQKWSTPTTTKPAGSTTTRPPSVMFQLFGWTDTRKQHRDYAERRGVAECVGCHSVTKGVPSNNPAAPSCFTCHGQKWSTPTTTKPAGSTTTRPPSVMFQIFGWTDSRKQHRDFVERYGPCSSVNGKPACNTCHSIVRGVSSPNPAAPSCYTCHGQKWSTRNCPTSSSTSTTRPPSVMYQLYGWTDSRKQHRDYAERNGVTQCVSCHSVWYGVPSPNPAAPSCYTCHGKKWDSTPPKPTTTTTGATTTTTTVPGGTTTSTTTPPVGLPNNCGMCHAVPVKAGTPDLCSPTFTAAKRSSMAGFTGGAVSVATIEAAIAAVGCSLVP